MLGVYINPKVERKRRWLWERGWRGFELRAGLRQGIPVLGCQATPSAPNHSRRRPGWQRRCRRALLSAAASHGDDAEAALPAANVPACQAGFQAWRAWPLPSTAARALTPAGCLTLTVCAA